MPVAPGAGISSTERIGTDAQAGAVLQPPAGQPTTDGAARLVGVTQPALTRSLRALPARVGAPLLARRSRGVVPTPLGELAAAEARLILQAMDEVERRAALFRDPAAEQEGRARPERGRASRPHAATMKRKCPKT